MGKYYSKDFANITSQANNAAIDVSQLTDGSNVIVYGTFTGTVSVQWSHNGTDFVDYSTALTAPGYKEKIPSCKALRLNCSAYTSGTIKGAVFGADPNRQG